MWKNLKEAFRGSSKKRTPRAPTRETKETRWLGPMAESALPPGWTMLESSTDKGQFFYYHEASNKTTWTRPRAKEKQSAPQWTPSRDRDACDNPARRFKIQQCVVAKLEGWSDWYPGMIMRNNKDGSVRTRPGRLGLRLD